MDGSQRGFRLSMSPTVPHSSDPRGTGRFLLPDPCPRREGSVCTHESPRLVSGSHQVCSPASPRLPSSLKDCWLSPQTLANDEAIREPESDGLEEKSKEAGRRWASAREHCACATWSPLDQLMQSKGALTPPPTCGGRGSQWITREDGPSLL